MITTRAQQFLQLEQEKYVEIQAHITEWISKLEDCEDFERGILEAGLIMLKKQSEDVTDNIERLSGRIFL